MFLFNYNSRWRAITTTYFLIFISFMTAEIIANDELKRLPIALPHGQ